MENLIDRGKVDNNFKAAESELAIDVRHISKRYRIGMADKKQDTLAAQIWYLLTAPLRNFKRLIQLKKFKEDDTEGINWALKDVSFQVFKGEVLGIIGHNGAGKSTLLKVLSRITEPTEGEIHIKGRVSSLLEVGTGFHPELSGRENVYMNGTILGMTKKEIDIKFDEIVEFSGIGKYLDTPVKFYSSGMKVRLAFSVAAHLDPEILIIDEVLAVGDAEFQKKCLGKMNEVASSGRTVLFVSHDMGAVKQLCSRCLAVGNGQIVFNGQTDEAVTHYLQNSAIEAKYENNNSDNKIAYIKEVEVLTSEKNYLHVFGRSLSVQIKIRTNDILIDPAVSFQVVNSRGVAVLHILNLNRENEFCDKPGEYHLICEIPKSRLYPDNYFLRVNFNMGRGYGSVSPLIDICGFEVVKDSVRELYWSKEAAIFIEDTNWKIIRNYD